MKIRQFIIALTLGTIVPLASAQTLDGLRDYTVITRGDFSTNQEVEGRTLVGGNLTGGTSNYGNDLGNGDGFLPTDFSLQVAGDILSNTVNINKGSVQVGGSANGIVNLNQSNQGATLSFNSVNLDVIDELVAASITLAALESNSTAILPGSQPAGVNFIAQPDDITGFAVFDFDGNALFNTNAQQFSLNPNSAEAIIFNIGGENINWTSGNLTGDFNSDYWRSRIIWNFYQAETVNFNAYNMMGQVLAPNATVMSRTAIDGSVFANSIVTTGEVHLPTYAGPDPTAVPEPSAALLGLLALPVLFRRKR